jgi:hypothetical protein
MTVPAQLDPLPLARREPGTAPVFALRPTLCTMHVGPIVPGFEFKADRGPYSYRVTQVRGHIGDGVVEVVALPFKGGLAEDPLTLFLARED